ncbi:cystatin-A1-like [Anoplopoma fimbria]|uniref:cystatin-A1-like n=1 Tax=Anoplopoma fimbria TaxID=229290 RepID=UPI0023ECEFF0|nr:cystatin-A1-like [Anoplopoma fimbria]
MADKVDMLGGWTETKATDEIQKISNQVKDQVERFTGKNYREFEAVEYRSQLVAGLNFLIKVHVGAEDYIHLRVFQALPCNGGEVVLRGVEQNRTKKDPLVPFIN